MADSPFELRLSHAAEWVRCAAFVRMNRTPQAAVLDGAADHTVREEGTAMHWVAQQTMYCRDSDYPYMPRVGDVAPNGVTITDEIYDGAAFFVDVLASYKTMPWRIEEQLAAPSIHPKCGGTPDAFGHDLFKPRIVLPDLKGGYRPVNVWPNWQLIGYAAAILDSNPTWHHPDLEIEFVIVQPRAYHRDGPVRKQVVQYRDLPPYIDALRMAAAIATGEHASAVAGPQCDDCAARASCSVCHAAGMRALEVAGEPDVHDLPIAAIDYEMQRLEDAARLIEARLTGLQAQAVHLIRRGETLPSYTLESGVGRLAWIDEQAESEAIAIAALLGVDIRKPAKAITPLQAMKQLPKEYVEQYARRNRGEQKLVRFDRNAAVKAFSHLKKD
jgi:cytochrome c553